MSSATGDFEVDNVLAALDSIKDKLSYEHICKFTVGQKSKYDELLKEFVKANELKGKGHHNLKGKALETLVTHLLDYSGGLFEVKENLRTHTNEIDQLFTLSEKGKVLLSNGLINTRLDTFLGECKNYGKSIDVTYTGKFCSLILTNGVKLGILFSYHGITGSGWTYGSGLLRKFYLHKEREEDRYCVIDFNIEDFQSISAGNDILSIVDAKLDALRFDTDFNKFLTKHPAEV